MFHLIFNFRALNVSAIDVRREHARKTHSVEQGLFAGKVNAKLRIADMTEIAQLE